MEKLLSAIFYSTNKHISQMRKDGKTPYISHPLAVALLLSRVTNDENVIIAGVLHDVIEDTNATEKELINLFGEKTTNIIKECTEHDRKLSWEARKKAAFVKIKFLTKDAALVKVADILHNTFEMVEHIKDKNSGVENFFSTSFEVKVQSERKRLEEFKKYHKDLPLLDLIEHNIQILEQNL